MQELCHMSITDIIHEDVAGRENCKRVIIKFIPNLPRNWREKYQIERISKFQSGINDIISYWVQLLFQIYTEYWWSTYYTG